MKSIFSPLRGRRDAFEHMKQEDTPEEREWDQLAPIRLQETQRAFIWYFVYNHQEERDQEPVTTVRTVEEWERETRIFKCVNNNLCTSNQLHGVSNKLQVTTFKCWKNVHQRPILHVPVEEEGEEKHSKLLDSWMKTVRERGRRRERKEEMEKSWSKSTQTRTQKLVSSRHCRCLERHKSVHCSSHWYSASVASVASRSSCASCKHQTSFSSSSCSSVDLSCLLTVKWRVKYWVTWLSLLPLHNEEAVRWEGKRGREREKREKEERETRGRELSEWKRIRSGCNREDQEVWPSPMILTVSLLLLRYISTCILLTVLLVLLVPLVPSKIPSKAVPSSVATTAAAVTTTTATQDTNITSSPENNYFPQITYINVYPFGLASGHILSDSPVTQPPLHSNNNNNNHKDNGHLDIGKNITKILNDFFEHGYDKRVRPKYGGQ